MISRSFGGIATGEEDEQLDGTAQRQVAESWRHRGSLRGGGVRGATVASRGRYQSPSSSVRSEYLHPTGLAVSTGKATWPSPGPYRDATTCLDADRPADTPPMKRLGCVLPPTNAPRVSGHMEIIAVSCLTRATLPGAVEPFGARHSSPHSNRA